MRKVFEPMRLGLPTFLVALVCAAAACPTARAVDLIGYLPYYRMNSNYNSNWLPDQLPLLDEIRYFGLTVNSSGGIVPLSGSGSYQTNLNRIASIKQAIDNLPVDKRPRLDIALGGAGEAATFSAVAANPDLHVTLADNVEALLTLSGATSVDIDWEHPSNANTPAGIAERNNYSLMAQRIKQEIGEDRRVYATMTPEIFMPNSCRPRGTCHRWDFADDVRPGLVGQRSQNNPLQGEHSVPQYVVDSLDAWTEPVGSPNDRPYAFPRWGNNMPAEVLGVGLPFYGRNISNGDCLHVR